MNENEFILAKSVAGHDKGSWYVVVSQDENSVFIADGRRRKLAAPKKKNVKHVELTRKTISLEHYTDKSLRKALWQYNFGEGGEDFG